MFGARRENVSSDACSHCNTVDTQEDDCVCVDCGLVLSQTQVYNPTTWSTPVCGSDNIHEFIRDVGENACMPGNVVVYAVNYYDKIKAALSPKFPKKTIAAYSLYESLQKFEVPRMAAEIQHFSGVKLKHIWQVESNLNLEQSLNNPTHYVHRFCVMLNFSYADQLTVKNAVEAIQLLPLGNLRCNCLVAVIIHLFCKEVGKKITLKKICETCDISATSVHRVIRQFSEHSSVISVTPCVSWIGKHVC